MNVPSEDNIILMNVSSCSKAGFNDLKTKNPMLTSEWHPIRNDGLLPDQVTEGSVRCFLR